MKKSQFRSIAALLAVGILGMSATTRAALITNSPNLPPDGIYRAAGLFQSYGGPALQFVVTLADHRAIMGTDIRIPGGGGLPGTPADELEDFQSNLSANAQVLQNGIPLGTFPITTIGLTQTIAFGKIGNPTGTFQTEMLQLNLSGVSPLGPFMIRESPTLPSLGVTSITPIGGGLFQIDSFFDVFTELSIDGGATWMPSTSGPGHLTLIPEPAGLSLLAVALVGLGFRRRR